MPQADSISSSAKEKQQTDQTAKTTNLRPQIIDEDNVDLYELWITIWKKKWLIIAVTVVAALGSIIYALQLERVYKAEALLLPPKKKDIQSMNIQRALETLVSESGIKFKSGLSPESVFSKFKQNIRSRTLHKKFINNNDLKKILVPKQTPQTTDEEIYRGFAELVKLKSDSGITYLSIEFYDAEIAAKIVNDFTEFVDKETVSMLVDDINDSIVNKIREIEYSIASKRHMAKQRREDRITQYFEAALIAQQLGVMDRVDSTNIVQNNQLNITTSNIPLYFRGYRALNTEILVLKSRQSDDPFIVGLRDLQEELELMRSIYFEKEKIHAVYVDQKAYVPINPVKPNRKLIVSIATVTGLISGIFLVFFIEFVQKQRKKHSR